jgi:hypothetical protein
MATPILFEGRRHFGNLQMVEGGLDDHFAGIFHACSDQPQLEDRCTVVSPQAAVVIANLAGEKQPRDKGKHWIAQITVQRRHSARLYPSLETVPHHQVIALPQLLYERRQMQEVVAVVCVPHNDIFPKGAVTAPNQGCAVSLLWHMHDPCPFLFGNLLGAVGTSVVRN